MPSPLTAEELRMGRRVRQHIRCGSWVLRHRQPPRTSSKFRCVTGAGVRGQPAEIWGSGGLERPCRMVPSERHPDKGSEQVISCEIEKRSLRSVLLRTDPDGFAKATLQCAV